MPVTIEQSNPASGDSGGENQPPFSPAADIPPWLAVRREQTAENSAVTDQPAASPPLPVLVPVPKKSKAVPVFNFNIRARETLARTQTGLKEWFSKQGMIGLLVSLLVHIAVLSLLACFLVSQVSKTELTTIWGMQGNSDELAADIILDSEMPGDEGESAPLQATDASQTLDSQALHGDIAKSMRIGLGGNGDGEGESGTGAGVGVGTLKIPGHAQTKGSFSAWSDPRDPEPGQNYHIVIQIRLPPNITSIRGSDISGTVIGTDKYRQTIRFKPNEQLTAENGMVQVRIRVPGAANLVRDTIRVESKALREKQTFEIEF